VRFVACCILCISLFSCGFGRRHSVLLIKEKGVVENYKYTDVSKEKIYETFPEIINTEHSSYAKVTAIFSQKHFLTKQHFLALQALKEEYIYLKKSNKERSSGRSKKLYTRIRDVFLDPDYDYRLRFKALSYMESLEKNDFFDDYVAETLEVMSVFSGEGKSAREIRRRSLIFIKKYNIM